MTPFWKLSAAGFAATAITFGPARMGFGLFLPEFRSAFGMTTGTAGLVSGLGFLGWLLGLLAAYAMTARFGPRRPVLFGLLAATAGMGLVAVAPGLPVLSAGIFLAMMSAGFSWSPFNNAVHSQVPDAARPAALSIVSTGTSLGVAAAGAIALGLGLSGVSWRIAWVVFATGGLLAALGNIAALRDVAGRPGPAANRPWGFLLRRAALPLYGVALSFGTTSGIFIAFAADRVEQAGGLPGIAPGTSPSIVFIGYGMLGLIGLATGRLKTMAGLAGLLRLLMLGSVLSLGLVALMPNSWAGVIASAGLQGAFVMMMSAILAFWSERLFPELPALSFTVALFAAAVGNVLGPAVAGFVADAFGAGPMFLAAAAVSLGTAAAIRTRVVTERPIPG